jgi:hypothetical protein
VNTDFLLLPYCSYPSAADTDRHGLQPLPLFLPSFTMNEAQHYRSGKFKTVAIDSFNHQQMLELARMLAESYSANEPILRHLKPPVSPPDKINTLRHNDLFGEDRFCYWKKENLLYWFIRLFVFTNPSGSLNDPELNDDLLTHSLAILGDGGKIIGGALNMPVNFLPFEPGTRTGDPFVDAVKSFLQPVRQFLKSQEVSAFHFLGGRFPAFKQALENGRVGSVLMAARSPQLPATNAFELIAASVEQFKEFGYEYVVTAATSHWMGAALELMGAVRVHYAPYRAKMLLKKGRKGWPDEASSADGYLSNKDSGCMYYVMALN